MYPSMACRTAPNVVESTLLLCVGALIRVVPVHAAAAGLLVDLAHELCCCCFSQDGRAGVGTHEPAAPQQPLPPLRLMNRGWHAALVYVVCIGFRQRRRSGSALREAHSSHTGNFLSWGLLCLSRCGGCEARQAGATADMRQWAEYCMSYTMLSNVECAATAIC